MNDYNIKKIYEDMEMEIISSMKRNYQRHLKEESKTGFKYTQWQAEKLKELKRYQRENKDIIGDYTKGLDEEISKHMQEELKQGSINAIKQYNKALGKSLKPSKIMNKSFFKTNDRKVNALIKSVNNDLKTANTAVLRMSNDQYRQVIHKSAMYVGNGVFTEKQASKMATKELSELELTKLAIDESNKDFLNRGLNCIQYKDGRRVNIASYAQMAVRTANLRAQLMGEGDFRKSIGRTLVQATSHGGACPICQKWEKHIFVDDVYSGGKPDGKHKLLSEAMKEGFLHPSCRHGLTTYYPELEGIENETEEEYQADMDYINERINYIDRNIKRFNRLENGSIADANIQKFANKKNDWIEEKEELLNKNKQIKNYIKSIEKGYWNNQLEYSIDDTTSWLGDEPVKLNKVIKYKKGDTFTYKGKKYILDGEKIINDYKEGEESFADILSTMTKKKIKMFPRFNQPSSTKSTDYQIGKEYFDYKHITSKSDQALIHNIESSDGQSANYIAEFKSEDITEDMILYQVDTVFRRKKYIKKIGIYYKNQFNLYVRK